MNDDEKSEDASARDKEPESAEPTRELPKNSPIYDAWISQMPPIKIPDSVFQDVARISNVVNSQMPRYSELFASVAPALENIARTVSAVTRGIDFGGIAESLKLFSAYAARQTAWMETLGPTLAGLRAAVYPPNLIDAVGLGSGRLKTVVMSDGIPLYGVPRQEIAEALLEAESFAARRAILEARGSEISSDCRRLVESCTSDEVRTWSQFALAAITAFEEGHAQAAQSMSATLVDTIVTAYFGTSRHTYMPHPQGKRTQDPYYEFTAREFLAFTPIWQAYQHFFPDKGDDVPTAFNRHATAHTVDPAQFNPANAVHGLMLACSLVYRMEEIAESSDTDAAA